MRGSARIDRPEHITYSARPPEPAHLWGQALPDSAK
jgi:hypothetical protein